MGGECRHVADVDGMAVQPTSEGDEDDRPGFKEDGGCGYVDDPQG